MADSAKNSTSPKSEKPKVYVYGHKQLDNGTIVIIFKDKVNKNPLLQVKAAHTGTKFSAKGTTMEEIKAGFPRGAAVPEASWGEEIKTEYEGVFAIEGLD